MIKFIVNKFSDKVEKEGLLNESELRIMKYGMSTVLSEVVKTIIVFMFFAIFGFVKELILCLAILLTLRSFMGGVHLKTFLTCLIYSFSMLILSIILLPKIVDLNQVSSGIILLISIFFVVFFSPVPSVKRPTKNKSRIRFFKLLSIFSILVWSYILYYKVYIFNISSTGAGIWIIFLLSIQLPIGRRFYNNEIIKKEV